MQLVLSLAALLLPATCSAAPVPAAFNDTADARLPAWELVGRMPTARLGLASAYEATADRIYCLGGEQFATNLATAESMDPADPLDGWRQEADMPEPRWQNAAVSAPGRVYTMGGFAETTPIASMVSIDTVTGAWRTETPMPTPRALLSAVYATSNAKIYAMGGRGAQDPFDPVVATVETYDPTTGQWSPEPDMPEQRQGYSHTQSPPPLDSQGCFLRDRWICHSSAAAVYVPEVDRIYVIAGGNGNGAELDTVDSMDVATGQWRSELPVPTQRTLVSATAINGRIYVIGGVGPAGAGTAVESMDAVSGVWRQEPDLPDDRWQSSAAAAGEKIFALGGNSNGGGLATVVALPTPANPPPQ